jgi:NAD(P)-dependent dehydrogenase (short-subunit alcohol dehydrogenase family)
MNSPSIVVVTGGAGDIGMAIATRFADRNARVILCDRLGDTLRQRIDAHPRRSQLEGHTTELTDPAQVKSFIAGTLERHGHVDVLVNNAAKQHDGDVVAASEADFEESFAINMRAPFLLSKAVAPGMKAAGGGAIVNISTIHAQAAGPGRCAYASTKSGLLGLTRSMAVDLGRHNIRVNAVIPTAIRTSGLLKAWTDDRDPEKKGVNRLYDHASKQHPMRRIGEADEVAELVEFLATCRYVNGEEIRVDGGMLASLRLLPIE